MESDCARYQLIARATYLPKGYLVAAATKLRGARRGEEVGKWREMFNVE